MAYWLLQKFNALNIRNSLQLQLRATCIMISASNQVNKDDAAIKMVNFNPHYGRWMDGLPNLTDPPLLGTSLTAVHPRKGILVNTTEGTVAARQPVYYLQMDDLRLGHAQGISGRCFQVPLVPLRAQCLIKLLQIQW